MAFPTVIAENGGNSTAEATAQTINLPDGSDVAGRRILVFFASDGSGETFTYPADWVEILAEGGTGFTSAVIYKDTLGTEGYPATGATITITVSSTEQSAHTSYLLSGFHTDAPAVATATTGTSVSGDPGALNPSGWDVEDTLWFAFVTFNGVNTTTPRISGYPTSYTNTRSDLAADFNGITNGVARRENATASEDPSTFTSDTSVNWRAVTVGVRPAADASKSVNKSEAVTVSESHAESVGTSQVNKSDAVAVAETITPLVTSFINLSDAAAVAEAVTVAVVNTVSVSDAVGVAESHAESVGTSQINVSDAVGVAESVTAVIEVLINVNDAVAVAESQTVAVVNTISVSDAIAVAEAVTLLVDIGINNSEAITTAESYTAVVEVLVNKSDAVAVAESQVVAIVTAVNVIDAIAVTESHAELIDTAQINVSDAIAVSESLSVSVAGDNTLSVNMTESISISEAFALAVGTSAINVSENISLAELLFENVSTSEINASETITVSESDILAVGTSQINVSDAISLAEYWLLSLPTDITGSGNLEIIYAAKLRTIEAQVNETIRAPKIRNIKR